MFLTLQEVGRSAPGIMPGIGMVASVAAILFVIVVSIVMIVRKRGEKTTVLETVMIIVAGLASGMILVYHASKYFTEGPAAGLVPLLGEISVVLILWTLFYRLHSVYTVADQMRVLIGRFETEAKASRDTLSASSASLSKQIDVLSAATTDLKTDHQLLLRQRDEADLWSKTLAELRAEILNSYDRMLKDAGPSAVLVRETYLAYLNQEISNLKEPTVRWFTNAQMYAALITRLGDELGRIASGRGLGPVMYFGNVLPFSEFYNSATEKVKNVFTHRPAMQFMESYRQKLSGLREQGVEQVRFTFVAESADIGTMEQVWPGVKLLERFVFAEQSQYVIYGCEGSDGSFQAQTFSKADLEPVVEDGHVSVEMTSLDQCYLLGPDLSPKVLNALKVRHKGLRSKSLYDCFVDEMHASESDCRVVVLNEETVRSLVPNEAQLERLFKSVLSRFPMVPHGGAKDPTVPVLDFVAFGVKTPRSAQTSPNGLQTHDGMQVLAVVASSMDFKRDTILLRLIAGESELRVINELMLKLLALPGTGLWEQFQG